MIARPDVNVIEAEEEFSEGLAPGTGLLHGQYVIERYLVHGGFGITYLARDSLDRPVVIKECFPAAVCCRVGGRVQARSHRMEDQFAAVLRHFIREAHRLSRLHHPDIVGVHQVFEERDTAYMVLDYVEGSDLLAVLEEQPDRLAPEAVTSILRRVLDAVGYIHEQGILHRDISPDNILLDGEGDPTLVDFGAALEYAARDSRSVSALPAVKDGYSPQEFYLSDEPQSPASDLYSLGATFYHLIIGEAPPDSQQRLSAVATRGADPYVPLVSRAPWYDREFLAAIDRSLELFPDDRFHSAGEWLAAIGGPARAERPAKEDTPAMQDADILRAISEAIAEAGADRVEPRGPRRNGETANNQALGNAEPGRPEPPRRFVDIFGNPIDDVEAWLEEQERELRRVGRRAGAPPGERCEGSDMSKPARKRRAGFFRAVLGRRSPQASVS